MAAGRVSNASNLDKKQGRIRFLLLKREKTSGTHSKAPFGNLNCYIHNNQFDERRFSLD